MQTQTIKRTVAGGVVLLLASAGAACSAKAEASESRYCDAARHWAVHELTPRDESKPAVFDRAWHDYLAFVDSATTSSPQPLKRDWTSYRAAVDKQTPVFAKYHYDEAQFETNATAAEQSIVNEPGDAAEAAFGRIQKYEALTCSAGQPPAADVSFKGAKAAAYCDTVKADDDANQQLRESGFAPKLMREAMTDPAKVAANTKMDARYLATAPAVIRDDVKANVAWWNQKQKPVVAKYGYDMKRVLLKGSKAEREALQLTAPSIRDHFARTVAFEQQVCEQ